MMKYSFLTATATAFAAFSKAQMNFKVRVLSGTSESTCDFGVNDEAVWGAKVGFQEKFKFFNGEGNSCPPINVNEDGPQVIYEETMACADQLTDFDLCLAAADSNGQVFGCEEVTESTVDCLFERCEEITLQSCFQEDCSFSLQYPMEARNPIVNTKGVKFLIERSGNCVTDSPTTFPTKNPTTSPTPNPTFPTPFPTFGCAGSFEACGGGPGYIGPDCCIANHVCEPKSEGSENLICKLETTTTGESEEPEETNIAGALSIGGIALLCLSFLATKFLLRTKPKNESMSLRASNAMFEDPNAPQKVPVPPLPPAEAGNTPEELLASFSKPDRRPSYDDVSV